MTPALPQRKKKKRVAADLSHLEFSERKRLRQIRPTSRRVSARDGGTDGAGVGGFWSQVMCGR